VDEAGKTIGFSKRYAVKEAADGDDMRFSFSLRIFFFQVIRVEKVLDGVNAKSGCGEVLTVEKEGRRKTEERRRMKHVT